MYSNSISKLPIFDQLASLTSLWLCDKSIGELPLRIFDQPRRPLPIQQLVSPLKMPGDSSLVEDARRQLGGSSLIELLYTQVQLRDAIQHSRRLRPDLRIIWWRYASLGGAGAGAPSC